MKKHDNLFKRIKRRFLQITIRNDKVDFSFECFFFKFILEFDLDLNTSGKRTKRSELMSDLRKMGGKDQGSEKQTQDDEEDEQ